MGDTISKKVPACLGGGMVIMPVKYLRLTETSNALVGSSQTMSFGSIRQSACDLPIAILALIISLVHS